MRRIRRKSAKNLRHLTQVLKHGGQDWAPLGTSKRTVTRRLRCLAGCAVWRALRPYFSHRLICTMNHDATFPDRPMHPCEGTKAGLGRKEESMANRPRNARELV